MKKFIYILRNEEGTIHLSFDSKEIAKKLKSSIESILGEEMFISDAYHNIDLNLLKSLHEKDNLK